MPDERDELTPAQQALAAAAELNEAMGELISQAQCHAMLERQVAEYRTRPPVEGPTSPLDDNEPPFAEVMDKIASAICDLDHLAGEPPCWDRLREAAQRWVRGED